MKKLQLFVITALCGAIFSISAQAETQGFGTVARVAGVATYSLGDGVWHPLLAGKHLPVGSTIRTGENGVVDVVLGKEIMLPQAKWQPDRISYAPDAPVRGMINYKPSAQQNVVRLTPNTTLAIDKLNIIDTGADEVSDTELNLKEGKIFASVKKLSPASQYLIKIPNGIAGVRGTLLAISADGTIACFESANGGVVLSIVLPDGSTKTYLVTPGNMVDGSGSSSSIPAELMGSLEGIFAALRTVYGTVVDFSFDQTRVYVSPTQGNHGKHLGWWHSHHGGGGNQD
jgi:hypothetical protein